jgi:hypothetical protein
MAEVSFREALTQAIRYWEPRRPLYNGLLLIVVVIVFVMNDVGPSHDSWIGRRG